MVVEKEGGGSDEGSSAGCSGNRSLTLSEAVLLGKMAA